MSLEYEQFGRLLKNSVITLPQSFYDAYIELNVRIRSASGLKELLIRRQLGKCCEWCANLVGIYEYKSIKPDSDIFKRHNNCKCMLTHRTEKQYSDVWGDKTYYKTQRQARIVNAKRIEHEIARNNQQRKLGESLEKEIDTPKVSSYNLTPELMQDLTNAYDTSVDEGMISPLVGFDTYLKDYMRIQNNIVGLTVNIPAEKARKYKLPQNFKIQGQSNHFLERIYGVAKDPGKFANDGSPVKREGVEIDKVGEAVKNGQVMEPKKDQEQRISVVIYDKYVQVSINPFTGTLIQCSRRSK